MKVDRAFFARLLLNAPVVGSLYLGLFYFSFVTAPLVPADQVLLGRDAKEIADYVAVRFASEIEGIGVALGLAALTVGAVLGLVALLLCVLRDRVRGQPGAPRTGLRAALIGLGLVVLMHACLVLLSMSCWPQLYAAEFWTRGGLLAAVQVLATDRLRTRGVELLFAALVLLFVLGPPWRWGPLASRALRFARGAASWKPRKSVLASLSLLVVVGLGARVVTRPRVRPVAAGTVQPPSTAASSTARRRSVIVIASDGLRNDRLRPEIAPRLSALADRGTRFDRAYVGIPRTMSSWATLLTGLHPHDHGIRSGFPHWEEVNHPLDSLPARLRTAGYRTAAVSDYAGDIFNRADFGFSLVDAPPTTFPSFLREQAIKRSMPLLPFLQTTQGRALFPEVARWSGAADPRFVASSAIDTLRRIHDEPFFMVVFFSTTHFPYAAPSPYHARFTRPDYGGPFRYDKTVMAGVPVMPNAADVQQIRGLYDGAVAAVDDAAGAIMDELARLGAAEDTIVVITSDHGETLFEHDRWHGHGDHLFGDESTHVPLVIVDPRTPPRREPALVGSVDLAPTLYELLGVTAPERVDGRSLAPAMRGEPLASLPVFAETELLMGENPGLPRELHMPPLGLSHLLEVDTEHGNYISLRKDAVGPSLLARHRMVREERWKLVYMPTPRGVVYRLFDTVSDPEELTDVLAAQPAEAERLQGLLWGWMLGDAHMTRDGDYLVPKGTRAPVQGVP